MNQCPAPTNNHRYTNLLTLNLSLHSQSKHQNNNIKTEIAINFINPLHVEIKVLSLIKSIILLLINFIVSRSTKSSNYSLLLICIKPLKELLNSFTNKNLVDHLLIFHQFLFPFVPKS